MPIEYNKPNNEYSMLMLRSKANPVEVSTM